MTLARVQNGGRLFSLMAILEQAVQHPAYHPAKSPIDPVI